MTFGLINNWSEWQGWWGIVIKQHLCIILAADNLELHKIYKKHKYKKTTVVTRSSLAQDDACGMPVAARIVGGQDAKLGQVNKIPKLSMQTKIKWVNKKESNIQKTD